jgi:hypothetical protein
MINSLEELKEAISQRLSKITFDSHFYDSMRKRPYLGEDFVISMLSKFGNYLGFQTHEVKGSVRYRIGISLSRKYTLVVVVEIGENLNIKTSWKTSRKWQKAIQK